MQRRTCNVSRSEDDDMAPKHIVKRYKTWYAILDIPEAVRGHFGGLRKFTKTLDTHDGFGDDHGLAGAPVRVGAENLIGHGAFPI